MALSYFKTFFSMEINISLSDLGYVDSRVTTTHNSNFLCPFSFEEFSIAVQQMHPESHQDRMVSILLSFSIFGLLVAMIFFMLALPD